MWRVCFLNGSPRRLSSADKGPWHSREEHARQWATWFQTQGYRVAVQHSSGDLYDGDRRIATLRGGRIQG